MNHLRPLVGFLLTTLIITSCAKPFADFIVEQETKSAPSSVQFENQSKKAEEYFWDFGDGNTSKESSPEHRYTHSGRYDVKLIAKKGNKSNSTIKQLIVEAPKNCLVEMKTTAGTMTIRLYDNTPEHRDNFIKLAEEGYYEGLLFHRVIDGFMIQGGDPNSKDAPMGKMLGSGGPGYQVPAEFDESYAHVKGALAAARMGDAVNPEKKSSGSQFYIVSGRPVSEQELEQMEYKKGITYDEATKKAYLENGGVPFLDNEYTVYGIVETGMDIIDDISSTATDGRDRPLEDVKILSVKVVQ